VDHQILKNLISEKIEEDKTLWLIEKILDSTYSDKGIPIGNLTSQLFANVYLNQLDQFAKRKLRAKYYLRYMDDFLFLDFSKKKLSLLKKELEWFLWQRLKLKLHARKTTVFPVENGINFLGYRNFKDYRLPRKPTVNRFVKRMENYDKKLNRGLITRKRFNQSLQSWLAYLSFARSWRLKKSLFSKYGFLCLFNEK